ncbi:ProQ/FINO family protein [Acinetobacter ursingii]|uniref:ProQ/FINO family protein n=1 Tax=Acinetobacter ursingii TaxID=108980 RepID=UPI00300A69B3
MASKKNILKSKAILTMLKEKYPHLIDYKSDQIIPLWTGITGEIIKDLHIHPDHHQAVKNAISYYQTWSVYLQALAFSRKKYSLWKEEKQQTSAEERNLARSTLIKRGLWTQQMEGAFKGKMLQKNIINQTQ